VGRFLFTLRGEIDWEWAFPDGSYIRAHQHASGARIGEERAIGKSRGGATNKIHMLSDANGNPVDFQITGGETHDCKVADDLIEMIEEEGVTFIADKGYDSESIREKARQKGITPVIPKRKGGTKPNPDFDRALYKHRHLVENLFAKLKHFRSIATRYEKLKRNYQSMLRLACSVIWLKLQVAVSI